jgi:hypothetical protein
VPNADIDLRRRELVCDFGSKHVVSRQRTPDTFERELANRLDCHGVLNRHQHAGTNKDLPWLGFIAKPRSHIGYRPDGGIIEAPFKADGAAPDRSNASA